MSPPFEGARNGAIGLYVFFTWNGTVNSAKLLQFSPRLYNSGETIQSLFRYGYETTGEILGMLKIVTDYFYSNSEHAGDGFCFMLAKLSCDVNSSIFSSFITARTVVFSFVAAE